MHKLAILVLVTAAVIGPTLAPAKGLKKAILRIGNAEDGRSELRLAIGVDNCKDVSATGVMIASSEFLNPSTGEIVLNQTAEIVDGRNGNVAFYYGDVAERAHSAKVRFYRIEGSKIWGEYEVINRDNVVWKESFVARRCSESK